MYRLYAMGGSGNCYKVELVLHQLDLPHRIEPVDILSGESRTAEFLEKNPNGRVPLLELPDGRRLAESNAMLLYLARSTPLLPEDPYDRALVYQWMFFEQYSHEPVIATNRFWIHLLKDPEGHADQIAANHPKGEAALALLDAHLQQQEFLVENRYTVADIALYAYTHVAPEGGYSLEPYAALRAWLDRVAGQPRHLPMRS